MKENDILQNGRTVPVRLLDGTTAEFKARLLTIDQWPEAAKHLNDEIALTAFIFGRKRDWLAKIHPADYKLLHAAATEVNAEGFFDFAGRERKRLEAEQQAQMAAFAQLPVETMQAAIREVNGRSSTTLPTPQLR